MGRPPCCDEYGVKKGPWTPEEDQKLIDYIHKNGHGSWRSLPKLAGLNRCGKSCRLRWTNYLRPDIKRGKFSDEEERVILNLHSALGNKWSRIATHLPGRTDNEIKNFWNTHLRKKLLQMGIDPNTHKPRTDLNLLVNLSQLLSSPNFGNLMNPFNNASLKLQADAAQLAKIQLVQNLLQVLSTSPPPNIEGSNLLGSQNLNPFEGLLNGTNTIYGNTSLAPSEFPNPIVTPQPSDDYQAIANSWACFDGGFSSEVLNINNNSLRSSYEIQTENPFPALVSVSPECSSANQIENKINPTYISTDSPTSSLIETWAELLMDDEAGGSDWNNILQ